MTLQVQPLPTALNAQHVLLSNGIVSTDSVSRHVQKA